MSFENPWMLLGMLAGTIPIAIHLINRQRARVRPFAALEFLLLSDKRLARRLQLKHLLVLVLRVLLLLFIPFALAKPFWRTDLDAPELGRPGSLVLVVDDSASMSARPSGTDDSLLESALEEAHRIVDRAGDRTNIAVVTASKPARLLTPELTYERTAIEMALSSIGPSNRGADLAGALREAERLLAQSPEKLRQVIVLGDQTRHAWSSVTEPWALSSIPTAQLIDVGPAAEPANLGIVAVDARPTADASQVELLVRVQNFGEREATTRVRVEIAGETREAPARLAPGELAVKRFAWELDTTQTTRGRAAISDDVFEGDNSWYFTLDFGETVRVAVVNGAPRDVPHLDELFFVRAALEPGRQAYGRIQPRYLPLEELGRGALDHLDVVVLANVGQLTAAQRGHVESFVEGGGGLLVTGGDQLGEASNAAYGKLLPLPIRGVKTVARREEAEAAVTSLRISTVDFDHPALHDFAAVRDASLFTARVYTFLLVDAARRNRARVIASFSGGIPALVEAELGQGRVLQWLSSIDADWTDLPFRTSFLPLVRQMVHVLAGRSGDSAAESTLRVGEPAEVRVPDGTGPLRLDRPDGTRVPLATPDSDRVLITETDVLGHYTLTREGPRDRSVGFSVNVDRAESDPTKDEPARIRELLERPGLGGGAELGPAAEMLAEEPERGSRTDLWPPVLFLLFLLLLSEAWLVLRS